jgi:hypothetical protein
MPATPSEIVKISRQGEVWESRARAGGVFIGSLAPQILVLDAGGPSAQGQGSAAPFTQTNRGLG